MFFVPACVPSLVFLLWNRARWSMPGVVEALLSLIVANLSLRRQAARTPEPERVTGVDELSPVELAYLAGGPRRAGRVVLMELFLRGRVRAQRRGGLITLVPLLFFAGAATRLPLSLLGLIQYLTPTMQFVIGVALYGEQMSPGRWVGFGLVWVALVLLATDGLRRTRRSRRPEPIPAEV